MTPERARADALEVVRAYHRATCHHPHRAAVGPYELDWGTQPDPFRRYAGAELLPLPRAWETEPGPDYDRIFVAGAVPPRPLDRATLGRLFYDSLAISAWKELGDARWSLRVNPSSGNLHPTEAHLACGPVPGLGGPLCAHYAPREHALEVRARPEPERWRALSLGLPEDALLVGLTSIHWREAWKYGERAYRYCQHDVGHAIACLSLAAACLGWRTELLDDLGSDEVRDLFGLADPRGADPEEPDAALAVLPDGTPSVSGRLPAEAIAAYRALPWVGLPNELSSAHVDWDAVEVCAHAARKPPTAGEHATPHPPAPQPPDEGENEGLAARPLIRGRRSAVALDGRTGMQRELFYAILARTLPRTGRVPFDVLPWRPRVHFGLFVHRVAGIPPGLYVLARDPGRADDLKAAMRPDFVWQTPEGRPGDLPLFLLREGDARSVSASVSCQQAIAADGCFSLGMLAEFAPVLEAHGPWFYPRLHWECGLAGQVLYLEAEAAGLRGTGIGCFFDEPVHEVFGLATERYRSLYHFTVGGALGDERLTTHAAYPPPPAG